MNTVLYRGVHDFRGHYQPVTGLAIHQTEALLISASVDKTIRMWSLETLEPVKNRPSSSNLPKSKINFSSANSVNFADIFQYL